MMAAARRTASPYARRLARERGISLAGLTGSGPGGRIVAADLDAFEQRQAPAAVAVAVGAPAVAAFAATLDLKVVTALLADFSKAEVVLGLDALLVRAAALALEAAAPSTATPATAIAWETGGGSVRIENAHLGLVSGIQALLSAGQSPAAGSALSLRRIHQSDIRPTAMPLAADIALRLVIAAADGAETAEALLSFDAARVDEDNAAALLARFRDGVQNPLRLLA
jgi:hypothetical protein